MLFHIKDGENTHITPNKQDLVMEYKLPMPRNNYPSLLYATDLTDNVIGFYNFITFKWSASI